MIEGVQIGSPLDINNFDFDLCSFFICGGNGSTSWKPSRCCQKAAKNCFRCDSRSCPLPWGFEFMSTALDAERSTRLPCRLLTKSCYIVLSFVCISSVSVNVSLSLLFIYTCILTHHYILRLCIYMRLLLLNLNCI